MLAVLAFVVSTAQSRPLRGGTVTDGTIVAITTHRDRIGAGASRRTMRTFAPEVEFRDSNGVSHTVTTSLSGGVQPTVGATVRVSYLPENPDRARILGDSHTRVGRYVFLVVGLGLIAAAIAL